MTITEAAEQVLFGRTLEEKLKVAPLNLYDSHLKPSYKTPSAPHRPSELKLSESGVRAQFPGVNVLDQDQPRGELLHFLTNHELLASELMALVLLKFPDAPTEYRKGVFEAMREEQMHTLMYLRRMKECGVEFGQLPLNSYFWRLVSPMKSPMEFVTQLNLTFEQANLDFSKHYAGLFREVGDSGTAAVLEKIYQDEIGHVGHGIKWLREWKSPDKSDWETYNDGLTLPFSASKAKGMAPYNPEGRMLAGLDEDFITKLSVYSQSRGRKPIAHWFNPNAESYALAERSGKPFHPNTAQKRVEEDLELLMLAVCKQDDLLLLRKLPSIQHLSSLREAGITIPEILPISDPNLSEKKIGGLIPWAWTPDSSETLRPLRTQIPESLPHQWRPPLPSTYFSKETGIDLNKRIHEMSDSRILTSQNDIDEYFNTSLGITRLKMPYACSGRGHFIYTPNISPKEKLDKFLQKSMKEQGAVLAEPEYERICDFSVHYDVSDSENPARLRGVTLMENTQFGQFLSAHVAQKWTSLLPEGIAAFLFSEANFSQIYHNDIPKELPNIFKGYYGPVGIDAFVYKDSFGKLRLKAILEINCRHTMGRIALNLLRMLNQKRGSLTISSNKENTLEDTIKLTEGNYLNAYWSTQ